VTKEIADLGYERMWGFWESGSWTDILFWKCDRSRCVV